MMKQISGRWIARAILPCALVAIARAVFLQWAPVILSGDPAPLPKDLFTP